MESSSFFRVCNEVVNSVPPTLRLIILWLAVEASGGYILKFSLSDVVLSPVVQIVPSKIND